VKTKVTQQLALWTRNSNAITASRLVFLVKLKYGEEWLDANLLNISLGGAAVSVHKMLSQGAPVVLRFTIPENGDTAEIHGRVAWATMKVTTGFNLAKSLQIPAQTCNSWFQIEMKKDGWREELVG